MTCNDTQNKDYKYNEYKGKGQISDEQIAEGITLKSGNNGIATCADYCSDKSLTWADKTYDNCYFAYNNETNKYQNCDTLPNFLSVKELSCYCGNPSLVQKDRT